MIKTLKQKFKASAKPIILVGASTAAAHMGCLYTPVIFGVLGGSLSAVSMAGMMLFAAPVITVASLCAMNKIKSKRTSLKQIFASAALAITVSGSIQAYGYQQHSTQQTHESTFDMGAFIKNMPICGNK